MIGCSQDILNVGQAKHQPRCICIFKQTTQALSTDSIETNLGLTALKHGICKHGTEVVAARCKHGTVGFELASTSNESHVQKLSPGSQQVEAIEECVGMWRRLEVNHSEPRYSSVTVP